MGKVKPADDAGEQQRRPLRRGPKELQSSCSPFVSDVWTDGAFWLEGSDGTFRNVYVWKPEENETKAAVLFLHGYGGNASRWQHVGEAYVSAGIKVYAMDQLGHGENPGNHKSGGLVGKKIDTFVKDTIILASRIREEHPGLPWFIVSMIQFRA